MMDICVQILLHHIQVSIVKMACSFSSTRNNNGASNKRPRAESVSSVEDNSDVDNVQSTVHDEFRLIKKAIESVLNPTDISSKPRSWSPKRPC